MCPLQTLCAIVFSPSVFVHWLITFEQLELATSDSAQIVENSKGFTNFIAFFRFRVQKCGLLLHRLITSELLELGTSDSA